MIWIFKKYKWPYDGPLYDFSRFGERPTVALIRSEVPQGETRLAALRAFSETFPDDPSYLKEYLRSFAYTGIYDDTDFDKAYQLLSQLGELAGESKSIQSFISKFEDDLKKQKAEFDEIEAKSPSLPPPADLGDLSAMYRHRKYAAVVDLAESSIPGFHPVGILGPKTEKRTWNLWALACTSLFHLRQPERAHQLYSSYELKRISVNLTPIPPYFDLQHLLVGSLLQVSAKKAKRKLQFWLSSSKVKCVSDLIKQHPVLQPLCHDI